MDALVALRAMIMAGRDSEVVLDMERRVVVIEGTAYPADGDTAFIAKTGKPYPLIALYLEYVHRDQNFAQRVSAARKHGVEASRVVMTGDSKPLVEWLTGKAAALPGVTAAAMAAVAARPASSAAGGAAAAASSGAAVGRSTVAGGHATAAAGAGVGSHGATTAAASSAGAGSQAGAVGASSAAASAAAGVAAGGLTWADDVEWTLEHAIRAESQHRTRLNVLDVPPVKGSDGKVRMEMGGGELQC